MKNNNPIKYCLSIFALLICSTPTLAGGPSLQKIAEVHTKPELLINHEGRLENISAYANQSTAERDVVLNNASFDVRGSEKIALTGRINLRKINARGNSEINLLWVTGDHIVVYAKGNSRIRLAGVAGNVMVILEGHAQLDAQYLRAKNMLIQTSGYSVARVLPLNTLRGFAYNASNIYYYKKPVYLTRLNMDLANVLQMAWRQ